MAGAILADLGCKVSKVEFEDSNDPFLSDEGEPLFKQWANSFSASKQVLKLSRENEKELGRIIEDNDIILCPPSRFFRDLAKKHPHAKFVEVIGGSGKQKFLHDLNALFLTKTFQIYLDQENQGGSIQPPYLPLAGIIFAQQIALEVMAAHFSKRDPKNKSGNIQVYLDQSVKNTLDKLWGLEIEKSETKVFLHNGKYPCYQIYRTGDGGFVAVAAVEARFWLELSELLGLNLSLEERFDASGKTGQKLSDMFLKYKSFELRALIGDRDICVNIIAKNL